MKKIMLLSILLTCLLGNTFAQSLNWTWNNCDKVTIWIQGYTDPLPGVDICTIRNAFRDCGSPTFPSSRPLKKDRLKKYKLLIEQRLRGSGGEWLCCIDREQDGSVFIFEDYTNPKLLEFRVRAEIRTASNTSVVKKSGGCGTVGRLKGDPIFTPWEIFEFGQPVPSAVIANVSGGWPFSSTFCQEDVDEINLFGQSSFAETGYFVHIKKVDEGSSNPQASRWFTGQAGIINLLDDVWTVNSPNWTFWPGEYEVIYAVKKQNCNGWVDQPKMYFTVLPSCRTGAFESENEISLYPNPASSILTVENLNSNAEEMEYEIYGSTGRLLNKGMIANKNNIDIQDLTNGTYMLRVIIEEEVITKKFIVSK